MIRFGISRFLFHTSNTCMKVGSYRDIAEFWHIREKYYICSSVHGKIPYTKEEWKLMKELKIDYGLESVAIRYTIYWNI